MTDEVDREVTALRQVVEERQREQQRAEAQVEAATAEEQRLLAKAREEFGVDSLEELEVLLSKVDAELAAEMAKVREGLAQTRREGET